MFIINRGIEDGLMGKKMERNLKFQKLETL